MARESETPGLPLSAQDMQDLKEQIKDELFYDMLNQRSPRRARNSRGQSFDPFAFEAMQRVMESEESAINDYLQELQKIRDPQARRLLRNIIMDERRHQMRAYDTMDMYANPGMTGNLRRRMAGLWQSPETRNFILGAGAVVLAMLLLPNAKKRMQDTASKAMAGIMGIGEQAKDLMAGMKEDIEDIVAEARFENLKGQIEDEITNSPPAPSH